MTPDILGPAQNMCKTLSKPIEKLNFADLPGGVSTDTCITSIGTGNVGVLVGTALELIDEYLMYGFLYATVNPFHFDPQT